MNIIHT